MNSTNQIGQLQEFNGETDDFELFSERLEQYFLANEIAELNPRRAALLLTGINTNTYKLLRDLCFPDKPKDKSYSELVTLLQKQLGRKRSVFAERCKFHHARQEESESIQDWTAKLKRLSTYCGFGVTLDTALRDRFIVGLKNDDILNRLFREPETLTFMRAVEIAEEIETAKLHAKEVKKEIDVNGEPVHRYDARKGAPKFPEHSVKSGKPARVATSKPFQEANEGKSCTVCGNRYHETKNCKFAKYRCRRCGVEGHLAKMCFNKQTTVSNNNCYWNAGEGESAMASQVNLFSLQSAGKEPIRFKVLMGKIPLSMEVDSGSGVSTISWATYKQYFSEYVLQESKVVLVSYTQGQDKPVGMFNPGIMYKGHKVYCNVQVVRNGGPPLCGRDLMALCGIEVTGINNIKGNTLEQEVLQEYRDVFKPVLGRYKYGVVQLNLKEGAKPVFFKPRPLPFVFKELVEKELVRLENEGIITPVEFSEWGTPLVPILKKDGTLRLCADYKVTLNQHLQQVKYPLPRIEELFTKLEGGKEFTKLDLSQAYNQLPLQEESKLLATWSTHKGLFKVNRLPYGVSPAAAKFQKMLEQLLLGIDGVVNFLDDIVVTGRNREEHLFRLRAVLGRMLKAGLRLKLDKCEFFKKEIKYLGYIIDNRGLRKDPDKIKVIVEAARPTTVTQVRSFVGMISYYSKFLPRLSTIMKPLYELLSKDNVFLWSKECDRAFKSIKELICSDSILVHYNPEAPLRLSCDASQDGIGAVLAHIDEKGVDRPIAYAARTLTKAERNYAMGEKEALAIYFGVRYFHQFLFGRPFTLATDHKPLLTIFGEHKGIPQRAAGRLQRWALFLSGYQYQIQYIPGRDNYSADYLSRLTTIEKDIESEEESVGSYLHFIETARLSPVDSKKIRIETRKDPILGRIVQYVNTGWPQDINEDIKPFYVRREELTIEQECIMWGYRVVVPKTLRGAILEELHATHSGMVKMKSTARSFVWWPHLDKELEMVVKACEACAATRQEPDKAVLIPWQRPKEVWSRLHVDYLGPVKGKMFLVVVDAGSKWPEVLEVSAASAGQTIQHLRELFARFGLPEHLVTDNGTQFTAESFQNFVKKNGIRHSFTAPGHPATNGQAENGVKVFKHAMYKAMKDMRNTGVDMHTLMSRYLFNYRNSTHCTTSETPAKLMFGRQLRVRLSMVKPDTGKVVEINQAAQVRNFKGRRNDTVNTGEVVMVRDYRVVNQKSWVKARVAKQLGARTYLCTLEDGKVWKRHLNQIQKGLALEDTARETTTLENVISDSSVEVVPTTEGAVVREVKSEEEAGTIPGTEVIMPQTRSRPQRLVKPPNRLNL